MSSGCFNLLEYNIPQWLIRLGFPSNLIISMEIFTFSVLIFPSLPHAPKHSYAIKPVLPTQRPIRPIQKPHTGTVIRCYSHDAPDH